MTKLQFPHIPDKVQTLQWAAFLMCILAAIFYCYEYILRIAPSVMRLELMKTYGLSNAGVGILAAWYYWAYVPLQIPVGLVMDRWGPRKILTLACLLCALGTYFFAAAKLLIIAQIGRFMVGFGSAFAYVGVLKITNLWLPRKFFAMMVGLCTALGTIVAGSGAIIMTKCMSFVGWQNTLYIFAILGIILTIVLCSFVRDKSDQEITQSNRAVHEGRSLAAELLEVIKIKQLLFNGFIGCLTYLPVTVFAEMWAVPFLKISHFNKDQAALGAFLVFLGFGLGAPFWGIFSDWIHSRKRPLILGASIAGICAWLVLYHRPTNLYLIYSLLFFMGLFASAQVIVFAVGNDICHPRLSATTVSYTNFFVMLGGMFVQPLVGITMEHWHIPLAKALMILPLGLSISVILTLLMQESYASEQEHCIS